jgi:hypothetical protein
MTTPNHPPTRRHGRRLGLALRLAVLCGGAALAVSVPPAASQAQGRKPKGADPRTAEAKKLFEQATDAYGQGRYEDAIRDWQKSYELSGKPLIFESIANAYERLGDKQKARDYLAKWRAEAPQGERQQLDARIEALDARIAAEKAQKDEAAKKSADDAGAAKAERDAQERARSTRLALAIAVGGAGVLAVGAGIVMGAVGAGQRPDVSDACATTGGQTLCKATAKDALEGSSTLVVAGDVTWIAGAVLVAAGGALLFTLPPAPSKAKEAPKGAAGEGRAPRRFVSVVPVVGPNGGGLGVLGRF